MSPDRRVFPLLMLPLALLTLGAAAPGDPPDGPAHDAWDRGMTALKAKDAATARAAFDQCLAAAPTSVECRWERGWAEWVAGDWDRVVADWEAVAAVNPAYETVATQLPQARSQRDLAKSAANARTTAPTTIPAPDAKSPLAPAIRLRWVGDMMIGTAFPVGALPPDEGAAAFASVSSLLQDADVTLGNLEGPLCDTDEPSTKCKPDATPGSCYAFRTPTSYAPRYKAAGFDVLSTANNHGGDFGEACRLQTEAALDAQGIRWSGRPGTFAEWTQDGKKMAFAAYHTSAACNDVNNIPAMTAFIAQLKATHDYVLVMFHGGAEGSKALHVPQGHETFYNEDRGDLRAFTHAAIDAGAAIVVGAGPHVLRGMEVYKGHLIAYSLGNFATYGRFNLSGNQGIGAILEVQLTADGRFSAGRILGTRQVGSGIPQPDPANAAADLIRSLSVADFPGTSVVVAQDGTLGASSR